VTSGATVEFLIFGHRGAPQLAPENSIEGIEGALSGGADGVEVDARCLSDGVKVLFHDQDIAGQPVERLTVVELSRLEAAVTLLDEAIEVCQRANRILIIEVKAPGWELDLARLVHARTGVIVSSFMPEILRRLKAQAPTCALGVITSKDAEEALGVVSELALDYIFPALELVNDGLIAHASRLGAASIPWTPNSHQEWSRLKALGCAGVITDVPDLAVAWRSLAN